MTPKPSAAKDLQKSPGQRSSTSIQATYPAAGKLSHMGGDNVGISHLATLTFQECCTHPPLLCMATAPGSKNSFPSTARSPQLLAFKMSRQAYITGSKKYVAWQTQSAGAKQGVLAPAALHTCSTPALEAMNSLNPSFNRAVTCLSPKEKNPSTGYSLVSAATLFKEAKSLGPNTVFLLKLVKFP